MLFSTLFLVVLSYNFRKLFLKRKEQNKSDNCIIHRSWVVLEWCHTFPYFSTWVEDHSFQFLVSLTKGY